MPAPLPPPAFGRADLWVRRAAAGVLAALAVGLVALGVALYAPHAEPISTSSLTSQEASQ